MEHHHRGSVATAGWTGTAIYRSRQDRVEITVGGFSFHTAEQGINLPWAYSFAVQIANLGPGIARDLFVGTTDEEQLVFSAFAEWPVLAPGEAWVTHLGLHKETPQDDPTAEEAWAYYMRAEIVVFCWDRRLRMYWFGSEGGGRATGRSKDAMTTPKQWHDFMRSVDPPRGDPPRASGSGRLPEH